MATVRQALQQAIELLNSDEARLEAQLLLQAVLQVDHAWLILHADDLLTDEQSSIYSSLLERRSKGEPIAYILGEREFYGLSLTVSEDTLIPRSDTETLVELALDAVDSYFHGNDEVAVLDMGTGTGAISLAIAHSLPEVDVTAVDVSQKALAIAQSNAERLEIENVDFIHSDWFEALAGRRFDLIVSNPPYIESADQHLSQGDLRFEPISALASGADGLDDIRRILADCLAFLKPQAWLMLEHGYNQAEAVQQLMAEVGLLEVSTVKDLGGNDRVTMGKNPLIVSQHWSN